MDPVALYDALNCASMALIAAEGGDTAKAETAYLEASLAAGEAFRPGSPGSEALRVILGEVRAMAAGGLAA